MTDDALLQALLEDYPELEPEDIRAALLYAGRLVAEERVIALSVGSISS